MDSDGHMVWEPNIEQWFDIRDKHLGHYVWYTIRSRVHCFGESRSWETPGGSIRVDPHRSVTVKLVLDHTFPYHVTGQRWLKTSLLWFWECILSSVCEHV